MSFHDAVTKFLSYFPFVLQGAIALVMIRRKLVAVFPWFFTYTIVVLCTDIALSLLPYDHDAYSVVYWSGDALAVLLGLTVIFEVLRHVLCSSPSGRSVLNVVWVLAIVAAIMAVLMLIWNKPRIESDWVLGVIVLAERSLRFLQAFLLIVVIAMMSVLGLTWQHESLGILLGFGVYAVVALGTYEFGNHLHLMSTPTYVLLNSGGYNVAVVIWAFYMSGPRRRPPVDRFPTADLAEWNNALKKLR